MNDVPGWAVPSGFTCSDYRQPGWCVDHRCRLEGATHLHEPFGRRKLTAEEERFVAAVEAELDYLEARDLGFC